MSINLSVGKYPHRVWFRRNCLLHAWPCLSVKEILSWYCNFLEDFASANSLVPPAGVDHFIRWIPPISGVLKLNSDASLDVVRKKSGLGVVIGDHSGAALLSCVKPIDLLLDPEIAEAMAILLGLSVAAEAGLSVGSVESDAANVISLLNLHSAPLSEIGLILDDIKDLVLFHHHQVLFSHVRRDANKVLLFGFLLGHT
ncbi:hypothetical protein ACOSQ4_018075 [Xanthoceras sorbifolium]